MAPGAGSEAELRRGGRAGEREDSDGACGLAAGWRDGGRLGAGRLARWGNPAPASGGNPPCVGEAQGCAQGGERGFSPRISPPAGRP